MSIKCFYHCKNINNFGDVIVVYVFKHLYGIEIVWSNTDEETLYMFTGSSMSDVKGNVICGCLGFININQTVKQAPQKILSVRGPITRKMLLNQGIECPERYSDLVQLLPFLFKKPKLQTGTVIIPHYVDNDILKNERGFVDITSNIDTVVNSCLNAERVITGSLHVMILCETFNIPYEFKRPINNIAGDGMKYHDFFESIGKNFKEGSF